MNDALTDLVSGYVGIHNMAALNPVCWMEVATLPPIMGGQGGGGVGGAGDEVHWDDRCCCCGPGPRPNAKLNPTQPHGGAGRVRAWMPYAGGCRQLLIAVAMSIMLVLPLSTCRGL